MKKAFDILSELGLEYQFHDYKKQGIDDATLQSWLSKAGAELILNKKGTTWRKLNEQEQQYALANETQLIETLKTHTSLIKRPVLETETGLMVGFNESQYRELKNN